ncbi:MAG: hypothetical protein NXH80_12695 [Rhodobacteraceae bacterium]|nr:hypothetical protein [Paracoccaceae bacterium]
MIEWFNQLSDEAFFAGVTAIVAALLGGLISLISALMVFWLATRKETKLFEQRLNDTRNTNARIGLGKLLNMSNQLYSIERFISKQLAEAQKEAPVIEPGLAVVGSSAGNFEVDRLNSAELEFLVHSKSNGLVSEIHMFQRAVMTHVAALEQYTVLRREFDDFSLKHGRIPEDPDGRLVSTEFDEKHGRQASIMLGSLNILLGEILTTIEDDIKTGFDLADSYREMAVKQFGEPFPTIQKLGGK